jgi:heme-degrading monooxygenase HmoA
MEEALMSGMANTPQPPYYAVIFTSLRREGDAGYSAMAAKMEDLARQQPGFLGLEAAREELGLTISYWESLTAIRSWKQQVDHLEAQRLGRQQWYRAYKIRICLVERDYGFEVE